MDGSSGAETGVAVGWPVPNESRASRPDRAPSESSPNKLLKLSMAGFEHEPRLSRSCYCRCSSLIQPLAGNVGEMTPLQHTTTGYNIRSGYKQQDVTTTDRNINKRGYNMMQYKIPNDNHSETCHLTES